MSDSLDYASIEIDPDEDPEDMHYTARRATLYRMVERAGTPAAVNRRVAGERFGVSRQTIQNDLDAISEQISKSAGGTRATATAVLTYQTAVRELLAEGEYMKAVRATDSWMSWLQETGRQGREPDRSEVAVNTQGGDMFTMDPKNEEHFEQLIADAEEACASCTVEHDGNGNVVSND